MSGRKKRFVPNPGTYWGQTNPTVRISVTVRRRTRVNHSSQAFVAKLWSIDLPAPPIPHQGRPQSRQENRGRSCQPPSAEVFDSPRAAGLVIGQLSDE